MVKRQERETRRRGNEGKLREYKGDEPNGWVSERGK